MSIPTLICRFRRALADDKALATLKRDLLVNLEFGAMSIWGCPHTPACEPLSEAEWDTLAAKLDFAPENAGKAPVSHDLPDDPTDVAGRTLPRVALKP